MRRVNNIVLIISLILSICPNLISAVDFNYDISVDTAFYKVKAFQTTITGTVDELFGTIINDYQAGIAKVAIIDFGINNSAGLSFDLILDSIYVRTYKETQLGFDLVGQADILRFNGAIINAKECAFFRVTLDYPHIDNYTSQYRVKIRIFGDYE